MPMSQSQRRRRLRRVSLHPVLAHKTALIVEDEPLVALDIHTILSGVGASVLSAASVSEANRLLAFADVACAIIDVHLGSEDARSVCQLLAKRGIPFVFYTGRADIASWLKEWPHAHVLRKPATPEDIVVALAHLFDGKNN
jgi:CheY-like chemotaxis protein